MDLRQLRYFIAVFEHGSISKAAADIPISQPALTRSMHLLEEELGAKLFHRHARGIAPTAAGERFYQHARSILAECARAGEGVLNVDGHLSGDVAVGVASLFATTLIDEVVERFCARHPRVRITVLQGFLEEHLVRLAQGEVELALCNVPVLELPDTHVFESLLTLRTRVYASASHPLARRRSLRWRDLATANWVNVSQPHSQQAWDALFINENVAPPHLRLRTNSLSLISAMIIERGFLGLLPEKLMAQAVREGKAVALNVPGMPLERRAGLLLRREGYSRPLAELFAEEVRLVCREQEQLLGAVPASGTA